MKTVEEKSLAEDSGEGSSSSNDAVNLTPPPVLKVSFNIYILAFFISLILFVGLCIRLQIYRMIICTHMYNTCCLMLLSSFLLINWVSSLVLWWAIIKFRFFLVIIFIIFIIPPENSNFAYMVCKTRTGLKILPFLFVIFPAKRAIKILSVLKIL